MGTQRQIGQGVSDLKGNGKKENTDILGCSSLFGHCIHRDHVAILKGKSRGTVRSFAMGNVIWRFHDIAG